MYVHVQFIVAFSRQFSSARIRRLTLHSSSLREDMGCLLVIWTENPEMLSCWLVSTYRHGSNSTNDVVWLSEAQEVFSLYDRDVDGRIAPQQVIVALRAVGLNPSEKEVLTLLQTCVPQGRSPQGPAWHPGFSQVLTHWGPHKRPPFSRRHFQMDCLEWKCIKFDWIVIKVCSKGSNKQYSSIASDNGDEPLSELIWTNDG